MSEEQKTPEVAEETPELETVLESETSPTAGIDLVQETFEQFLLTADVSAVYGAPYTVGENTIIPAAEVLAGMGIGAGFGSGSDGDGDAGGGGGGGGGRTFSRPVAVIIANEHGVRVEPIVDVTKIALAALTAVGFMVATLSGMLNPRKFVARMHGEE
ncbi:MAG: hypothetical protein OHK0052_18100 [Anaerolineales bacterium]